MVMVYDHGSGQVLPWVLSKATYDRIMPKEPEPPMPMKNDYACADCGAEKDTMKGTCDNCGSVRIILISMIEESFGKNWRDNFKPNPDPATPDHPEVRAAVEQGNEFLRRWRDS